MQDAAEAVELAQHGTMPDAASAKLVVVGAGIGRATERGEGLQVLPPPLNGLALTARVATNGPTGQPTWYLWEDSAFWILTEPWTRPTAAQFGCVCRPLCFAQKA